MHTTTQYLNSVVPLQSNSPLSLCPEIMRSALVGVFVPTHAVDQAIQKTGREASKVERARKPIAD